MVTKKEKDSWSVAEARARFSELIRRARSRPQLILSRGRPVAAVISADQHDELLASPRPNIDQALADVRRVIGEEEYELEVPVRVDRKNPFVEKDDDPAG